MQLVGHIVKTGLKDNGREELVITVSQQYTLFNFDCEPCHKILQIWNNRYMMCHLGGVGASNASDPLVVVGVNTSRGNRGATNKVEAILNHLNDPMLLFV